MTIVIISVKPLNKKPGAKVVKMNITSEKKGAEVIEMFPAEKQRA